MVLSWPGSGRQTAGIFLFLGHDGGGQLHDLWRAARHLPLAPPHLPERWQQQTAHLGGHLKKALHGWVRAELRLMLITFGIVSAGLFVLGIDFPLVLGAVIAVVDALPVFGTGTVLIPWGLWSLLQGDTVLRVRLLIP